MSALTINEPVLERLAAALRKVNGSKPDGACFRLIIDEEDYLALAVDIPSPDDKTFEYYGETVLVMSNALAERFAGRMLEVNPAGDFVLA